MFYIFFTFIFHLPWHTISYLHYMFFVLQYVLFLSLFMFFVVQYVFFLSVCMFSTSILHVMLSVFSIRFFYYCFIPGFPSSHVSTPIYTTPLRYSFSALTWLLLAPTSLTVAPPECLLSQHTLHSLLPCFFLYSLSSMTVLFLYNVRCKTMC
jgi:hypothetical protein